MLWEVHFKDNTYSVVKGKQKDIFDEFSSRATYIKKTNLFEMFWKWLKYDRDLETLFYWE